MDESQSSSTSSILQKHQANISRLAQAFGFDPQPKTTTKKAELLMQVETPFDRKVDDSKLLISQSFSSIKHQQSIEEIKSPPPTSPLPAPQRKTVDETELLVQNFRQKYAQYTDPVLESIDKHSVLH